MLFGQFIEVTRGVGRKGKGGCISKIEIFILRGLGGWMKRRYYVIVIGGFEVGDFG